MSDAAISSQPNTALIYVFDVVSMLGILFLSAIIIIAWRSPSLNRSKTWYSFLASWIVYDVVNLLLLGQQTGDEPGYGLCLAQASLHYTVPVLSAFACVAMVLQLFLSVAFSLPVGNHLSARKNIGLYLLLIVPPGLSLFVFLEALIYGIKHPDKVVRSNSGMFCKISDTVIMKISAACVIFAMLCIMLIEICIAVTVCRHWKAFHKLAKYERDSRKWENCKSIIRFTFFFMLAALCFGISIALSFGETNDWDPVLNARSNIVTEIMPMAVAVTFGTQKDILRSLIICKRRKHLAEDNIAAGQAISQNKAAIPA